MLQDTSLSVSHVAGHFTLRFTLQDTSLFVSHVAEHFTLRFTCCRTLHSSFHMLQDTSLFVSHVAGHFTLRFTCCRTLHYLFHILQDSSMPVSYVQDTSLYVWHVKDTLLSLCMLQDISLCQFTKLVALDFVGGFHMRLETIQFRILLSEASGGKKCSWEGIIKIVLYLHQLPFSVFSRVI